MRRDRRAVKTMAAVVRIRQIEQQAAEASLQRAAVARGDAEARLEAACAEQASCEEAWLGAVNAAQLDLQLSRALGASVTTALAVAASRQDDLKSADAGRAVAADALGGAQSRLKAASSVADALARRVRRRADEDRLAESAERTASRWSRA